MKDLRRRFDRFCLKNRSKGIPSLMLYIGVGNVIVYLLTTIDPSNLVYLNLYFSKDAILAGQVWRLFTYIFTYIQDMTGIGVLLSLVSLFCYYQFGKILEASWGTLRFNLYYLCGVLLTDIGGLVLGYSASAAALNLSLFLAVATVAPDARVLLMFIIPIRFKVMAWVYLIITALNVIRGFVYFPPLSFLWLEPLIPLANYFLFFGEGVKVLLPESMRYKTVHRQARPKPNANWASSYRTESGEKPYRHKCTVCGRTDTQYPNLEFRYCSKCKGYYCYCIDHINDHAHIQ